MARVWPTRPQAGASAALPTDSPFGWRGAGLSGRSVAGTPHHCGMRVAVVGAGPAGLAAARAFRELGLDVVVFEAAPDIGGGWSATRRYPGIATQNDKHTYAYSDRRVDDGVARAPARADVRAYLQAFARDNGLEDVIRLRTRVAEAEPVEGGWTFQTHGPDGVGRETADWLIVANGLCSMPYVPEYKGCEEFETAGGRLL